MAQEYDPNDPKVIAAQADAREKELQARAQLHWTAQLAYTILEQGNVFFENCGCFAIIILFIIGLLFIR